MEGRDSERLAEIIKSAGGRIFGKLIGRVEIYANKVSDCVVVLGPWDLTQYA